MALPFYVYMLLCADGSYYVGHTDDLAKRVSEHQTGTGCMYTSRRLPVTLAWVQETATRGQAKDVEAQLKGWSRAKKQALIRGDFGRIRQLARKRERIPSRERKTGDEIATRGSASTE